MLLQEEFQVVVDGLVEGAVVIVEVETAFGIQDKKHRRIRRGDHLGRHRILKFLHDLIIHLRRSRPDRSLVVEGRRQIVEMFINVVETVIDIGCPAVGNGIVRIQDVFFVEVIVGEGDRHEKEDRRDEDTRCEDDDLPDQ